MRPTVVRARDPESAAPRASSPPGTVAKAYLIFALVAFMVRIHAAVGSRNPFETHLLCPQHRVRLRMPMRCPEDGAEIVRADALRGIEVERDRYVMVTPDELAALPVPSKHEIAIEQFVPSDQAGSVTRFARQAYYLSAEPAAAAAYGLIRDTLRDEGLVAIGRVTLRERERLAAIEPFGPALLLTTLHWPDEVRSYERLELPGPTTASRRERTAARQLAVAMTGAFDPAAYTDRHAEAFEAMVATKLEGGAVVGESAPVRNPFIPDLMAALEASIVDARSKRHASAKDAPRSARPKRTARKAPREAAA